MADHDWGYTGENGKSTILDLLVFAGLCDRFVYIEARDGPCKQSDTAISSWKDLTLQSLPLYNLHLVHVH